MDKKYGLLAAILLSITIIVYSCIASPTCTTEGSHYHDGELYYKDTVIVIDTFKRYKYKMPDKHKQFKDSVRNKNKPK